MRLRLVFVLLVACTPAAAQTGRGSSGGRPPSGSGGTSPGRQSILPPLQNPSVVATYLGTTPFWGSLRSPSFNNPSPFAFPCPPGYGSANGFGGYGGYGYGAGYGVPINGFGGGWFNSPYGFYPPQQAQAPANVIIAFPPQASPVAVAAPQPASQTIAIPTPTAEIAAPPPIRETATPPARSPAIVAVKDGNVYSVKRYWSKNGTLHFVTTNGEQKQIPMSQVERIYPAH